MISVTENAAEQIQKLLVKERQASGGLRVGVKAGGCSGFEYVFEWEDAPRNDDLIFEALNGVRVWIDPRSHRVLDGTTLDYDTSLLSRGFVFNGDLVCDFGTVARGVCQVNNTGYLTGIVEMTAISRDGNKAKNTDADGKVTSLTGDEPVSMNYWGFTPKIYGQLREHFNKKPM